jgi:peroxiredoxin Q/BCP
MALFGAMMWISLAREGRAADDAKAKGEKKEAKSDSNASAPKLEGKEAPPFDKVAIGMSSIDPEAEGPGAAANFRLSNYRGKNIIVLAFFTDATDTNSVDELRALSGQLSNFQQNKAIILGISNCPVDREKRLIKRDKCGFPMLGDPDSDICRRYGVVEKGKVSRVTFIVDQKGIVRKVIDTKDPKKHAQEVLDYVKNLKS